MILINQSVKTIASVLIIVFGLFTMNGVFAANDPEQAPDFIDADDAQALLIEGGILAGGTPVLDLSSATRDELAAHIQQSDIKIVQYGDTITLILPADRYFQIDNAKFNEDEYSALYQVAQYIKTYGDVLINIAGFTDNTGTPAHQQTLSEQRAQTVLAFLWARGIDIDRLNAVGKGADHDIADNTSLRGKAFNRRIEIQWRV